MKSGVNGKPCRINGGLSRAALSHTLDLPCPALPGRAAMSSPFVQILGFLFWVTVYGSWLMVHGSWFMVPTFKSLKQLLSGASAENQNHSVALRHCDIGRLRPPSFAFIAPAIHRLRLTGSVCPIFHFYLDGL